MAVVLGVSKAIARNKAPGETPTRLDMPGLSLEITREKSDGMDKKAVTAGQGSFTLPNMAGLLGGTGVVDAVVSC